MEDKDLPARIARRFDRDATAAPVLAIRRGTWAGSTDWNTVTKNIRRAGEPVLDRRGAFSCRR